MSRSKRAAWVVLTAPFLLAFSIAGAGATTAEYANPAACNATVNSGVCISRVASSYSGTMVTVSMTVGITSNPATDPNWNSTYTTSTWIIPINGAPTTDSDGTYTAVGYVTGGAFVGSVLHDAHLLVTCGSSVVTAQYAANTYTLTFPSSCIGSPNSFATYADFEYDPSRGTDPSSSLNADAPPAADPPCCSIVVSDDGSTTTTSTSLSTTSTTVPASSTTTTTPSPASTTTSTTATALVPTATSTTIPAGIVHTASATSTTSPPSRSGTSPNPTTPPDDSLAFTGPGTGVVWILIAGSLLMLIGIAGRRRQLRRRSALPS